MPGIPCPSKGGEASACQGGERGLGQGEPVVVVKEAEEPGNGAVKKGVRQLLD